MDQSARHATRRPAGALAGWVIAWIGMAIGTYLPFTPRPFDFVDFSEFLPLLRGNGTWLAQVRALSGYYAAQGRVNVAGYGLLAAKWQLFGADVVLWQLTRAVQLAAVALLLFLVLRRWGASRLGACSATTLVLAGHLATGAWLRFTMAEPIGTVVVLALFLAVSYPNGMRNPVVRGALVCAVVFLGFLKEVLVVSLAGVVVAAVLVAPDGHWRLARPRREHWIAGLCYVATSALCAVPVLSVMRHSTHDAYASLYGLPSIAIRPALLSYLTTAMPFVPLAYGPVPLLVTVTVAFTLLVLVGWSLYLRRGPSPQHANLLLAFALLYPVGCALVYMPWPLFQPFYGLPFIVAPAVLLAFAITGLESIGRAGSAAAAAVWGVTLCVMLAGAHAQSRSTDAGLRLSVRLVQTLRPFAGRDSMYYSVRERPRLGWIGRGETVRRQALLDGIALPPARDLTCGEADDAIRERVGHRVMVVAQWECGNLGTNQLHVSQAYPRFDLARLRLVADSVTADVVSW